MSGKGGVEKAEAGVAPGGLKKGPWTAVEDAILVEYVKKHGEGNWNAVQKNSGLARCGKSCRLRWANHLRPNLKKGSFSPQEERIILELHAKLGNKWARMAAHLPGRTDNEIKNYWNTRIKRQQRVGLPLYPPDILLHQHNPQSPSSSSHSPSPPLHFTTPPLLPLLPPPPLHFPPSSFPFFHEIIMSESTLPVETHQPNVFNSSNLDVSPPFASNLDLPLCEATGDLGQSNSGLLDAMLQNSQMVAIGSGGDEEGSWLGTFGGGYAEAPIWDYSTINNMDLDIMANHRQPSESNSMEDASTLFEMNPTPATTVSDQWHNDSTGEISNIHAQSATLMADHGPDDNIGIEIRQLASSFTAPNDDYWTLNSCSWNN